MKGQINSNRKQKSLEEYIMLLITIILGFWPLFIHTLLPFLQISLAIRLHTSQYMINRHIPPLSAFRIYLNQIEYPWRRRQHIPLNRLVLHGVITQKTFIEGHHESKKTYGKLFKIHSLHSHFSVALKPIVLLISYSRQHNIYYY